MPPPPTRTRTSRPTCPPTPPSSASAGTPGFNGGSLQIKGVDNVIVRNLTFESPLDCFPQWDPTDGDRRQLELRVRQRGRVRRDACVDGPQHVHRRRPPRQHAAVLLRADLPAARRRARHRQGADYVTASWNVFADHDKTILIGNSDSASTAAVDRGHLKVTFHHNLFSNLVERAPRVRFGQVDSYNNHFVAEDGYAYSYGIGIESQLVAEHNAFTLPGGVGAGKDPQAVERVAAHRRRQLRQR